MARRWIQSADVEVGQDGSLLVRLGPHEHLRIPVVLVDTASKSLATLLGAALSDWLKELELRNQGAATIYLAAGEPATTGGVQLPAGASLNLPVGRAVADTLRFIVAADTVKLAVIQLG